MGLQRERTLLAWNRTLLALVVATALVARTLGPPWVRPVQLPVLGLVLVVVWLWLTADVRYRRPRGEGRVGTPRQLLVLGLTTVAVGVGGVVAVLLG